MPHFNSRGAAGTAVAIPAHKTCASADAARGLPAAVGGARRPRHLGQARRHDRPCLRRQQGAAARIRVRPGAGERRGHRGRRRLHPVELVPPDHRGGAQIRARAGAGPRARAEGPADAGQPAPRPAHGCGRDDPERARRGAAAASRGEGRGASKGRAAALRHLLLRSGHAVAGGARLCRGGAGDLRPARARAGPHLRGGIGDVARRPDRRRARPRASDAGRLGQPDRLSGTARRTRSPASPMRSPNGSASTPASRPRISSSTIPISARPTASSPMPGARR